MHYWEMINISTSQWGSCGLLFILGILTKLYKIETSSYLLFTHLYKFSRFKEKLTPEKWIWIISSGYTKAYKIIFQLELYSQK